LGVGELYPSCLQLFDLFYLLHSALKYTHTFAGGAVDLVSFLQRLFDGGAIQMLTNSADVLDVLKVASLCLGEALAWFSLVVALAVASELI
jgi:hypothetical protein